MNSIESWTGAMVLGSLIAICPQKSLADGFTGKDFLKWSTSAQESYFQTSVTMAAIMATRTHKASSDCLGAWYLAPDGAHMAYFGEDLNTLFRLASQDLPDRVHAAPLVPTDKLEILVFAPDTGDAPVLYAAEPQEVAASEPIWKVARDVRIGISWEVEGIDLDLYVRPTPASDVIYYGNADTEDGRLFKDYTSSPDGFETVALTEDVFDLSQLHLVVNFYGGRNPGGIAGELRIAIGHEVWAHPFHIPAARGNQGDGAEEALVKQERPNDAWLLIDPASVLGIE